MFVVIGAIGVEAEITEHWLVLVGIGWFVGTCTYFVINFKSILYTTNSFYTVVVLLKLLYFFINLFNASSQIPSFTFIVSISSIKSPFIGICLYPDGNINSQLQQFVNINLNMLYIKKLSL